MRVGALQERIAATNKGAIPSVQAVYVPADDPTDEDTSEVVNSDADDGDNNGSESPDDTATE